MRRFFSIFSFFLLLIPLPAAANIKVIKNSLQQGYQECKSAQYQKGIDRIINAAMELRKKHPKSSLNRKWRTYLRLCYKKWSVSTRSKCYKNHDPGSYKIFAKIKKKAKYTASSGTKKMIATNQKRCLRSLKRHYRSRCKKNSKLLDKVIVLNKYLQSKKQIDRKLSQIARSCRWHHWQNITGTCSKNISLNTLKKVYFFRKKMGNGAKVNSTYHKCLLNLIKGAGNNCQKEMEYTKNTKLINKTIQAMKRSSPSPKILRKAQKLKYRCGIYRLKMDLNLNSTTGGIYYNLPSVTNLVVTKMPGKSKVKACGKVIFKPVKLDHGRCQTTITVTKPTKAKEHIICFQGKLFRKKGKKYPYLFLKFNKKATRGKIKEVIHKTCKKGRSRKTAAYFKETLFANLLSPKHLKIQIRALVGEKKGFRVPLDLGKGRKVVFKGFFKVHYWK